MVRFKQFAEGQLRQAMSSFNSTMVRFKPAWQRGDRLDIGMFQFHDGSIQAFTSSTIITLPAVFQFHDGSIQAQTPAKNLVRGQVVSIPRWFDSSLKLSHRHSRPHSVSIPRWFDSSHASQGIANAWKASFNSTMVRFKQSNVVSSSQGVTMFQFHDGSIQAVLSSTLQAIANTLFQFHDGSIQARR